MRRGAALLAIGGLVAALVGSLGHVVAASRVMLAVNVIVLVGAAVEWAREGRRGS